jgi:hypothetical protein
VVYRSLIYWRIKYLKLKYGLSLLKIHEKYKKYIFRIIFYVSLIKNDKQTKKWKEINIFKSLALSNVFSTKSEEQEVNLVWPNLCIFWLPFICLYRSWSWSLPNFVLTGSLSRIPNCVMSIGPPRKSPGRIYKCHFTSGRRDSDRISEYMCHNLWQ